MSTFEESGCGCCEPAQVPGEIYNRPALPAIEYRSGTYSRFLQAMLQSVAAEKEALPHWTSREPRDFGMQFLDLWAYLGDILTFYQERIANEAFLGTATQRESVLRLAALIDYRLGPGAAATVQLAFTLDSGKQLTLPVGLKAQSVPGPNEKPQKFETVEAFAADARWNRIRVFPQPEPVKPFASGSHGGTVVNDPVRSRPLAAGMRVLVFDDRHAEIKEIASIRRQDTGLALAWTAPVKGVFSNPAMMPYGRQFRLFGSNSPEQFMIPVADSSKPGGIRWTLQSPPFTISANASEFALESVVEGLKPGSEMLVVHVPQDTSSKPFVRKGVVVSADPKPAARGSLQATVTHVKLQLTGTIPSGVSQIDLRQVTLFELTDAAIQLADTCYPEAISANRVFVPLTVLSDFPSKRSVILDDGQGGTHVAAVDSATPSGGHLQISFTPSLPRKFSTATCVLLGNVVKATHGETVQAEVLGNGDASARFQKFRLKKSPVTFVSQPGAPNGVASTLQVRADGVLWNEARTLLGAGPNERRYTTIVGDDGQMAVQFGGEPGARLPSGRHNVTAQYRKGLGPDGNVKANAIATLLDKPAGLKSVVNPAPASGGSAPEPLAMARRNAPNTVRTFGRIVSRRDFEDAARELAVVAKASASLHWNGAEQEVLLTVAGEAGAELSPEVLRDVLDDLNSRRDRNRRLVVSSHKAVPVRISGRVQVQSAYLAQSVIAALQAALGHLFGFDQRELGQPAFVSEVFRVCQTVTGVTAVDLDEFRYRDKGTVPLADALIAEPHEILQLAAADLDLRPQFATL